MLQYLTSSVSPTKSDGPVSAGVPACNEQPYPGHTYWHTPRDTSGNTLGTPMSIFNSRAQASPIEPSQPLCLEKWERDDRKYMYLAREADKS